jgi:hypothetical protein
VGFGRFAITRVGTTGWIDDRIPYSTGICSAARMDPIETFKTESDSSSILSRSPKDWPMPHRSGRPSAIPERPAVVSRIDRPRRSDTKAA